MARREIIGTISFNSTSALALWRCEVLGQLSDGAWECTEPSNHWEFWHKLRTVVTLSHRPMVTMDEGHFVPHAQKCGYNIAGLYEYLQDRMLAYGRMGRALSTCSIKVPESPEWDERHGDTGFDAYCRAGEYLTNRSSVQTPCPSNIEDFLTRKWDTKDNYWATYLKVLDEETARRFFATKYTMRDLRADVRDIKAAMKSVKEMT